MAVVLCQPLGWPAEATYQTYRRWADALAQAGFPVLRFDYAGTGDSPGNDEQSQRLAAWISSVHAAVEAAKRLGSRDGVTLAGMHLGATLAALAAADRDDVEAFLSWGMFVTGRAYVRQVRAYRMLNALPPDPTGVQRAGEEEAAGYRLTASTVAELSAIDLSRLSRPPARQVLLLGIETGEDGKVEPGSGLSGSADRALAERWRSLGTSVRGHDLPGWLPMLQEPRKAVVPEAVLAESVRFLSDLHPTGMAPAPDRAPSPDRWPRGWECQENVTEELVCIGEGGTMSGVLSRPARALSRDVATVLFLTTASHHRIGPNRLWVRLARAVSARGIPTLRFDLAGVGDSLVPPGLSDSHAYSRESVSEVRAAMDALERSIGTSRFVLVGLCSGAYLAYHSASDDPRVVAAVLVNPQTFSWKDGDSLELKRRQSMHSLHYYRNRLFQRESWSRALRGEIDFRYLTQTLLARVWGRIRDRLRQGIHAGGESEVAKILRALDARGTDVHFLFGADDEGRDMLSREAAAAVRDLSASPRFQLDVIEGPAHTFEQLWAQEVLTSRIVERLTTRFAPVAPRSATG